jgi:hypothetical protein
VIRGVKVAKLISSTWPTGSGDVGCEAIPKSYLGIILFTTFSGKFHFCF